MADVIVPSFKAFRADRKLIATLTDQPQLIRYLENLGIDATSTTPDLFEQLLSLIIDASESATSAQGTANQVRQNIDELKNAIILLETNPVNVNELKQKLDELDNLILGLPLFSAADKTKLDGIVSGAGVVSVSGTAPIVSSGGTTPAISINAATPSLPGSLSAADKTKLDSVTSGAAVSTVGATAPITSSGGTNPTIGISANPTFTTATLTNGQLVFPAIQVPSANVNTLDDYKEGTYTPTITASSGTLTTVSAIGTYVKIGRQVTVNIQITLTTNGTGATALVASLPFTVAATTSCLATGVELNVTGKMLRGFAGGSTLNITYYDNTYPGGNGTAQYLTATYFV